MASALGNLLLCGILLVACGNALANPSHLRRTHKPQAAAGAVADEAKPYRIASLDGNSQSEPLAGMLLPTIQYAVQDIYFMSPPQFPPRLNSTARIYEGQWLIPVPVVTSYAIGNDGRIDIHYALEVVQPDGIIEEGPQDNVLFQGQAPERTTLLFPSGSLGIFYTDTEQGPGKYTFRVRVHDRISDEKLVLETPFEVHSYTVPDFPADTEPDIWLARYYQNPQPGFALPALTAMMSGISAERLDSLTASMLGFYNQLLSDNPWLLPYFSQQLEQALDRVQEGGQPDTADIMLGLALSFHLRSAESRPQSISERIWLETESNRQFDWSYIAPSDKYIHYPQQLDYLWGQFFASGSYQPVNRLLEALFQDRQAAARATPEALAALSPEQRSALSDAVQQATQWSLASNASQHRLVMAYLVGTLMHRNEALTQADREKLQKVLTLAMQTNNAEPTAGDSTGQTGNAGQTTNSRSEPAGDPQQPAQAQPDSAPAAVAE